MKRKPALTPLEAVLIVAVLVVWAALLVQSVEYETRTAVQTERSAR